MPDYSTFNHLMQIRDRKLFNIDALHKNAKSIRNELDMQNNYYSNDRNEEKKNPDAQLQKLTAIRNKIYLQEEKLANINSAIIKYTYRF
jgi:hypothetical protein